MGPKWPFIILFFIILNTKEVRTQQCEFIYKQNSLNHDAAVRDMTSKIISVALQKNRSAFEILQELKFQTPIAKASREIPNFIKMLKNALNAFEQRKSLDSNIELKGEPTEPIQKNPTLRTFEGRDFSKKFKDIPFRITPLIDGTIIAEFYNSHFAVLKPDPESKDSQTYENIEDVVFADKSSTEFLQPLPNGGTVAVYSTYHRNQYIAFFEPGNFDPQKARKSNVFLDYNQRSYSHEGMINRLKVLKNGRIFASLPHGRFLIYSEGINHQGTFSSPYETDTFIKAGPDQLNDVLELPNEDLLTFHDLYGASKGAAPGSYIQYWTYDRSTQSYFPKKRFSKNIDSIRGVRSLRNGAFVTLSRFSLTFRTWYTRQMTFSKKDVVFKDNDGKPEGIIDLGELDDGRLVVATRNGLRILKFNASVGLYEIAEQTNLNMVNKLMLLRNNQFVTISGGFKKMTHWKPLSR